jgi:phosphoglycerol geranylgeranyltransferase
MNIYDKIKSKSGKQFAVLVDPDKKTGKEIAEIAKISSLAGVDYIFVGGSLLSRDAVGSCLQIIRDNCKIPLVLFPGSVMQVHENADAILLLSLISGRNAELLIGNHVIAAPYLLQSGLEILPTGYMLIESGPLTTAQYISHTLPIPSEKDDIAVWTAVAGEMLGLKLIYLDAGSGAHRNVPVSMIREVRKNTRVPLIVGGGIRTADTALEICRAGADLIVVGNAIENKTDFIREAAEVVHSY